MGEPCRATPCHPWGGLDICCSPARIAPSLRSTFSFRPNRSSFSFPAAPIQRCQSGIGRRARREQGLARSTSSAPLFTLFALPTSLLYFAPSSAPHNCIQPYPGTEEPRDLTASSRYSPEKHWSLHRRLATLVSYFASASTRARRSWATVSGQTQNSVCQ